MPRLLSAAGAKSFCKALEAQESALSRGEVGSGGQVRVRLLQVLGRVLREKATIVHTGRMNVSV